MSMRIALDLFWGIIRQTLQGEGNKTMIDAMPRANDNTKGLLYIMSLHPEGRYKIGWSRSVEQLELQIKEGRIWVPELELVGYWPVLKKWEAQLRFVIASSEPIVNRFAQYPWSDWKREAGGEVIEGFTRHEVIERAGHAIAILSKNCPELLSAESESTMELERETADLSRFYSSI